MKKGCFLLLLTLFSCGGGVDSSLEEERSSSSATASQQDGGGAAVVDLSGADPLKRFFQFESCINNVFFVADSTDPFIVNEETTKEKFEGEVAKQQEWSLDFFQSSFRFKELWVEKYKGEEMLSLEKPLCEDAFWEKVIHNIGITMTKSNAEIVFYSTADEDLLGGYNYSCGENDRYIALSRSGTMNLFLNDGDLRSEAWSYLIDKEKKRAYSIEGGSNRMVLDENAAILHQWFPGACGN